MLKKHLLHEYTCERLSKNRVNNQLIPDFLSKKSLELMVYLKKHAWNEDQSNMKSVYLIKEKSKIVGYFSLQSGLFVKCDQKQLNGLTIKTDQNELKCFVDDRIEVSAVIPGIELVHFCLNDNYREKHYPKIRTKFCEYNLGVYIFYKYIAPIVLEVADKIGVRYLYLYCADDVYHRLSNYYTTQLHFKKIEKMSCLRPDYDENLDCYAISIVELRRDWARFDDLEHIRVILKCLNKEGEITYSTARKKYGIYDPCFLFRWLIEHDYAYSGSSENSRDIFRVIKKT